MQKILLLLWQSTICQSTVTIIYDIKKFYRENYFREKTNGNINESDAANYRIDNSKTATKYLKLIWNTSVDNNILDAETALS